MKNQSLLYMAAPGRARSPFLWAVALRIRQQSQRRSGIDPVPEGVIEFAPRRCVISNEN